MKDEFKKVDIMKYNELLIGSNNKKKLNELKSLIDGLNLKHIEIKSPKDYNLDSLEIEENGSDFFENSLIKAKTFFDLTNIPTLSDDSGLIVECLGGEPGLRSARYAGENATDDENIDFLLNKIKILEFTPNVFKAKYVTTICFYDGEQVQYYEGFIEGRLINEKRGFSGFGYDPIFIPNGYNHTFAEMGNEIKQNISHRKIALDKFIDFLISNYKK